eukprot:30736-Hanusia_phi.AAC.1
MLGRVQSGSNIQLSTPKSSSAFQPVRLSRFQIPNPLRKLLYSLSQMFMHLKLLDLLPKTMN